MLNLKLKQRAIQLRREGKTYTEIRNILKYPLPKGTLSNWLKPIKLTKFQMQRVFRNSRSRSEFGRRKAGWKNHQKRLDRIADIQERAEKEFPVASREPYFLAGLLLYLAEGSKKFERFQFMNSDPYLCKMIVRWVKTIDPRAQITIRLYIHKIYQGERCEQYWSSFLKISLSNFRGTVYKPTSHLIKKNPGYRGCARIEIAGSELFWKIMKWRDMLYENL